MINISKLKKILEIVELYDKNAIVTSTVEGKIFIKSSKLEGFFNLKEDSTVKNKLYNIGVNIITSSLMLMENDD